MTTLENIKMAIEPRIDEAISVVVSRQTADGFESAKLAADELAGDAFRSFCRRTMDELADRVPIAYTVDAELDPSEVFILDNEEDTAELSSLTNLGVVASTLPPIAPSALDLKIQIYAVVVGDDDRIVFVKRTNPSVAHAGGRWFAPSGQRLTRLEQPAFAFSPGFDLILGAGWVVVLNQSNFEKLFREIGLVDKHIKGWVDGITTHLPMDKAEETKLLEAARADSRLWRRLREIHRRGHLAEVSIADIRKYAKKVNVDPDNITKAGKLIFDPMDRCWFLHLLNEDLFRGELTNTAFEAQRKSTASA